MVTPVFFKGSVGDDKCGYNSFDLKSNEASANIRMSDVEDDEQMLLFQMWEENKNGGIPCQS